MNTITKGPSEKSLSAAQGAATTKVPFSTKVAFGISGIADNIVGNGVHQLANPIYNITLGVNPAVIGAVLAIGRLLDAVIDPIIGNFSDNFRSRLGRRRPLVIVGAALSGLMFFATFAVPRGWGSGASAIYFAAAAFLFFPAYALLTVPKGALVLELTTDYHERTRVAGVMAFLTPLGGIAAVWLFALTKLDLFRDPLEGVRYVALGAGLIILILGSFPAWRMHERDYARIARQPRVRLRDSVRMTLRNRPLILISIAGLAIFLGIFTVYGLGLYVNIYYINAGDAKTASVWHGAVGTAYQVASMISAPLIAHIATKAGKRYTLIGCLSVALLGTLLKWSCFTPGAPALMFIPMSLMGVGMSGYFVLTVSMMADICDYDEWNQGFRREAMISAVYAWIFKSGMSFAYFLSGIVLLATGFREDLAGMQAPATILWMRILFSFIPATALIVAIGCVWAYPITEEKAHATRNAINRRNDALPP